MAKKLKATLDRDTLRQMLIHAKVTAYEKYKAAHIKYIDAVFVSIVDGKLYVPDFGTRVMDKVKTTHQDYVEASTILEEYNRLTDMGATDEELIQLFVKEEKK